MSNPDILIRRAIIAADLTERNSDLTAAPAADLRVSGGQIVTANGSSRLPGSSL
jgi:hypothetical protein